MIKQNIDILNILKTSKLKATPARISILEIFCGVEKPLSVEMIDQKLKDKRINQVTIYRTVESLLKVGIIIRVDLRQDSVFYEFNGGHNHHHHIVCTKCGEVEDFESCQIEHLSAKIISKSIRFKTIQDHSFELFGICNSCSRKNA
ncbi:MAG: Fur family transcriptional regulator [Patescibacteria group bacterium]